MKKMNNKGFLMVEALIVSTFVVSVLIYFFVQFKKVDNSFELSYSYDTVNGLYAVNNISVYLDNLYETDSDFKRELDSSNIKTSAPYYKVIYNQIDDENFTCISSQSYCGELMQSLNIKKAILASGNLDALLRFFKDFENGNLPTDEDEKEKVKTDYNFFTEKMRDFIKHERSKELYSPDYKILVQFNDDTFASIDKVFEKFYNRPQIIAGNVTAKSYSITIPYILVNTSEDYQIGCSYGTTVNNLASNNVTIENNKCIINGLIPDTEYYYSLSIKLNEVAVYETEPMPVTTSDAPTITVESASRTTNTITISYILTNSNGNFSIICMYGDNENTLSSNNVTIDNENNKCIISGLNPGTEYYYSLGIEYDGETRMSDPVSITTKIFGGTYVAKGSSDTHQGIVYMDPTRPDYACTNETETVNPTYGYVSTTGTTSGCMKWFIYEKDSENVKMILDHNTTARFEISNTSYNASQMLAEINERLEHDTADWSKAFTTSILDKSSSDSAVDNSWKWFLNNTYGCTKYNICNEDDNNNNYVGVKKSGDGYTDTGNKGTINGCWIGESSSNTKVFILDREGTVKSYSATLKTVGIRPIVTIPLSWLE